MDPVIIYWESRISGIKSPVATYTPISYGLREGQRLQGSNGNMHLQGTRGNGGGMLRQKEEVEAEPHTVFVLSWTNS